MTFMHLTKARLPTTAACSRTVKTRCAKSIIISGGESSVLMDNEMLTLSDEERKKAGISNIAIGSAEVLAIKAGMAITWNRMRLLRW